jgi:hypothetical protein
LWQAVQFAVNNVAPRTRSPEKLEPLLDELLLDELLLEELLLDARPELDEELLEELLLDARPELDEELLDELLEEPVPPPQAESRMAIAPITKILRMVVVAPHLMPAIIGSLGEQDRQF